MQIDEDKGIEKNSASDRPTIPTDVTPETNLESLNLNWREKDLPEKKRTKHVHRLHPYLGKFVPQLVEIFLRKYFVSGQTVLDPFAGSGTTLVQANELGIHAIGYDVSAFNVLLCRAKTAPHNLDNVRQEVMDILEKTRAATQTGSYQLSLWEIEPKELPLAETDNPYLLEWFAPQARHELLTYCRLIDKEGYEYRDLLKIILCRAARSARLTTHFDLDFPKRPQTEPYHCYKHGRICQPTTEAIQFLDRYSRDTIKRIAEFAELRTNATVTVHHADSLNAVFPRIDGVITSPPYVGLIDYHEQHCYAYNLLGLEDRRDLEIGSAAKGASKKAKRQYQEELAEVFRHAADAMSPGGYIIVVAGDRDNLYGEIADMVGVKMEGIIQRQVNRRTGRRKSEFYESVFIWRKP